MKKGIHITLKPGERIYINGAVLKVDRKVSVEFLNDVTFLLESHVLMAEETTTPLRQLYFIVQMMLIDPANGPAAWGMFERSHALLLATIEHPEIGNQLRAVHHLVATNRPFEALKAIRALFPLEAAILAGDSPAAPEDTIQNREVA
jgi:flagellar protein FlbT